MEEPGKKCFTRQSICFNENLFSSSFVYINHMKSFKCKFNCLFDTANVDCISSVLEYSSLTHEVHRLKTSL